jgi:hypothetical protein
MRIMSNYQIGAFEALEWAWHMLRTHKDNSEGVEDARRIIKDVLSDMGEGTSMNFGEYRRHPNSQDLQQNIMVTSLPASKEFS